MYELAFGIIMNFVNFCVYLEMCVSTTMFIV